MWATSALASDNAAYAPSRAFDGDPATAWVEGVEDVGAGETLTLEFDEPVVLEGVGLVAGYTKSDRLFARNAAPTTVALTTDGRRDVLEVGYVKEPVAEGTRFAGPAVADDRPDGCYHAASPVNTSARRLVVFEAPREVRRLSIEVVGAARGTHYQDTALSEVVPLVAGGDFAPGPVAALTALRTPGGVDRFVAPSADVHDLRVIYLTPGLDGVPLQGETAPQVTVETPDGYDVVAWARVPPGERLLGSSLEGRFVRYARPSLVGTLVSVLGPPGAERIVGARSFHRGDCEWVESYPVVGLEGDRVVWLEEWVTGDGCPGCTWRLPTDD